MTKRNPNSPWNPSHVAEVTPEEYERQVVEWLKGHSANLENFAVSHLEHLQGAGGDYEFDGVARFEVLEGARLVVLVECKRYSRPVERKDLLVVWAKLQDVKAHKALVFATCGFQSGALEYAKTYGIATITFVQGDFLWETRGVEPAPAPPPWANLPRFAGIYLGWDEGKITGSTIESGSAGKIGEWLSE